MPDPDTVALARRAAQRHGLDPDLVCAVIAQESEWDTYAIRYEPMFQARYVAGLGLSPTEAVARSISWGLMQVMGQTAYEFGYRGDYPALCDPSVGVEVGCKVLAHKIAVNQGNVHDGLQAWNGGENPSYANEVMARIPRG